MKTFLATLAALTAAGLIILFGNRLAQPQPDIAAPSPTPTPEPSPYFVTVTLNTDVYAADQTKLVLRAGDRVKVVTSFDSFLVIEHEGKRYGALDKALTRQD